METIIFLATGILQVYEIDILCKVFSKNRELIGFNLIWHIL